MTTVSLSSGVRAALTSIQSSTAQSAQGQFRLATGKKVNSAVDNPVNFFISASLNDRASQLTGLLDGISNGIQTIQAASKGIDSITKLVSSAQSTIKQAQSEAAQNRPKITGTADLGTAAEATLTGSSRRDVALNKVLIGTAATATASTAGVVGLTAAGAGETNAVQLRAGNTTYKFDVAAGDTVRDFVNEVNKSGIATASVGDDGRLTITGTGSDALTAEVGTNVTATGVFTAVAGDSNALIGTGVDITDVVSTANSSVRSTLVKQFNDLRTQIDSLAKDSGYNGINLLDGDKLEVTFNEKTGAAKNKIDIQGSSVSSANLGIDEAVDGTATTGEFNIQNDSDLTTAADSLTNVLSTLRATSSSFGSNLSIVQTRQDFTKDLINTLTTGADNLVLADSTEEGAKLLALQTRQQLSQTSLTLANQADQAVLRLF